MTSGGKCKITGPGMLSFYSLIASAYIPRQGSRSVCSSTTHALSVWRRLSRRRKQGFAQGGVEYHSSPASSTEGEALAGAPGLAGGPPTPHERRERLRHPPEPYMPPHQMEGTGLPSTARGNQVFQDLTRFPAADCKYELRAAAFKLVSGSQVLFSTP